MESITDNSSVNIVDPWAYCEGFAEMYHITCGRYMAILLNNKFQDFPAVAAECGKTTRPLFYETCYETLGYRIAQLNIGDFDGIKKTCDSLGAKPARAGCYRGAAIENVFQQYQSWEEVSTKLCYELEESGVCLARLSQLKKN